MKIVILDAYTVDQGELTWDGLTELAEVEAYERTAPEEVIERCKGAEMVLTNKVVLDASVLNMLPRLQYIGVLATGYNVVDLEVASRQNIVVTNIPAYSTESVAQMVFCHLLNIVSHVDYYAIENRSGRWSNSPDFCYLDHNLFEQCDIISLHCPLTDDTFHLVNAERLATMKPSAILINTGRGPLVDDAAVAEALNSDQLAAYGADVITTEPPASDNPLLSAKNSYLTPHIAWATHEARQRLINICTENVRAYLDGEPVNQVN